MSGGIYELFRIFSLAMMKRMVDFNKGAGGMFRLVRVRYIGDTLVIVPMRTMSLNAKQFHDS